MPAILDMSRIPTFVEYHDINLAGEVSKLLRHTTPQWAADGLIKSNDSFGMAMAKIMTDGEYYADCWDNPYELIWFAAGWGPEAERYMANAIRKMRASAREGVDSLDLLEHKPRLFRDEVGSERGDREHQWGDFPWGGAAYTNFGDKRLLTAVSCLKQQEDHWVALMLGGFMATQMHKADERFAALSAS